MSRPDKDQLQELMEELINQKEALESCVCVMRDIVHDLERAGAPSNIVGQLKYYPVNNIESFIDSPHQIGNLQSVIDTLKELIKSIDDEDDEDN